MKKENRDNNREKLQSRNDEYARSERSLSHVRSDANESYY